jgi:methylated-DNA-protein-cysteine methyltransferase related protein
MGSARVRSRGEDRAAILGKRPDDDRPDSGDDPPDLDPPPFREAVLGIVSRIPEGRLASYGQVAALAGYPRRPRQVGMVLRGLPEGTDLPWHRVVNAQGYVPSKGRWWGAIVQIERLREEGIPVDGGGTLDLEAHRWRMELENSTIPCKKRTTKSTKTRKGTK